MFSKLSESLVSVVKLDNRNPNNTDAGGANRGVKRKHEFQSKANRSLSNKALTESIAKRNKLTEEQKGFDFSRFTQWFVRGKKSFEEMFFIKDKKSKDNVEDKKSDFSKQQSNVNGTTSRQTNLFSTPQNPSNVDYTTTYNISSTPFTTKDQPYNSSPTTNVTTGVPFFNTCYTWQQTTTSTLQVGNLGNMSQQKQNNRFAPLKRNNFSYHTMYDKTYTPKLHNSMSAAHGVKKRPRPRRTNVLAAKEIIRLDEKRRYAALLQQFTSTPILDYDSVKKHAKTFQATDKSTSLPVKSLLGTVISPIADEEPKPVAAQERIIIKPKVIPAKSDSQNTSQLSSDKGQRLTSLDKTVDKNGTVNGSITSSLLEKVKSIAEKASGNNSIIIIDDDDSKTKKDQSSAPPNKEDFNPESLQRPPLRQQQKQQPPIKLDPVKSLESVESLRNKLKSSPYGSKDWLEQMKQNHESRCRQLDKELEITENRVKFHKDQREEWEKTLLKRLERRLRISSRQPAVLAEDFEDSDEEDDEFPELDEEADSIVDDALRSSPGHQVLSEGFRLQITRTDMATLKGLNWLNDEIINFYMELLRERGKEDNNPSVHVFNTFFYPKIMSNGHQGVRRWTKQVDLFTMDYIIIPVHLGMHWCLAVVDFPNKQIRYYDSMGGTNDPCLRALRLYLQTEHKAKKQSELEMSDWELINVKDIPHQMNGSDCGVFTCKFAEYITRNKKITFTQDNMPYFRRRMIYEIINKKLL